MMRDDTNVQLYQRLQTAIWRCLNRGDIVPCVDNPGTWDENGQTAVEACQTCPVLTVCRPYAVTGAVTHGIVAGLSMEDLADRRRALTRRARQRRSALIQAAA